MFASVSADGSVRVFDLRCVSFVMYRCVLPAHLRMCTLDMHVLLTVLHRPQAQMRLPGVCEYMCMMISIEMDMGMYRKKWSLLTLSQRYASACRSLDHSRVLYEGEHPLVRLSWNKSDPNYIGMVQLLLFFVLSIAPTPTTHKNEFK